MPEQRSAAQTVNIPGRGGGKLYTLTVLQHLAVCLLDTPKNVTGKSNFCVCRVYFSVRRKALGVPAPSR
jgi:hypothetical protein